MANGVYVAALLPEALAGMPMPPIAFTRAAASLSVFAGAPAIAMMIASVAAYAGRDRRAVASMATVAAILFAAIAILNRAVQLVIMAAPAGSIPQPLDLYVGNTPANFAEMFAWDLCLGVAALGTAAVLTGNARWPRRWLAFTGVFALAGECLYLAGLLGAGGTVVGIAGMAVSVTAWVVGLTATAIAAIACQAFRDAQDRRLRPHPSPSVSRPA